MKLSSMLSTLDYKVRQGSDDLEVKSLCYHTGSVEKECVFVCIVGTKSDGHHYIEEAIDKGSTAIVVSRYEEEVDYKNVTVIQVEDTRKALAFMSKEFFDHPDLKLKMIGITGTKGKTTTCYMIRNVLEMAGIKTGLIGTIEVIIGENVFSADNTTPESYVIYEYLDMAVKAGLKCVVMEVSSQGLKLSRVDGIIFDYAVFMNLSQDHIGQYEHKDFNEYLECKKKLFKQCRVGIFNLDDPYTYRMMGGCDGEIETFGLYKGANHQAIHSQLVRENDFIGSCFDLTGWYNTHIVLGIPGKFNIYNALAAIAVLSHFSVKESLISFAFRTLRVKGRVEIVPLMTDYTVMIDYAHNAMSLESILKTLREYKPNRILCMFGCGGNRDRNRRFEMGEISSNYADFTVVTSDNPRNEKPEDIIEDIVVGVKKGTGEYIVIPDRKEAIRYCIKNAKAGDIVLFAGKGHETYQEICGVKYAMDERELIKCICQEEDINIDE